jgi:hypothetical protein
LGKWVLEGAFGVWLYAANKNFPGGSVRTQTPLGSMQAHIVRHLPHRTWAAFDYTFFTGGRSAVNGQDLPNYQGNMRFGATLGVVFSRRHSLKVSYFKGAITRVGSDIGSIGIANNVFWLNGR